MCLGRLAAAIALGGLYVVGFAVGAIGTSTGISEAGVIQRMAVPRQRVVELGRQRRDVPARPRNHHRRGRRAATRSLRGGLGGAAQPGLGPHRRDPVSPAATRRLDRVRWTPAPDVGRRRRSDDNREVDAKRPLVPAQRWSCRRRGRPRLRRAVPEGSCRLPLEARPRASAVHIPPSSTRAFTLAMRGSGCGRFDARVRFRVLGLTLSEPLRVAPFGLADCQFASAKRPVRRCARAWSRRVAKWGAVG